MGLQLHTRNLGPAESMTLDGTEGVLMMSYQMSGADGDNGQITGTLPFKASSDLVAQPSEALDIPAGAGNVFTSDANQKALMLTIQCNQGTLKVIIGQ